MVVAQVAILAHTVGVVRPVGVRALVCKLLPPHHVVAVLAHALCVERPVRVWAFRDDFLPAVGVLLLGLFLVSGDSPAAFPLRELLA